VKGSTIAAIVIGAGLASATIVVWNVIANQPGPAIFAVADQRQCGVFDPNAPALFGNTYSARSKWSSDAMGN